MAQGPSAHYDEVFDLSRTDSLESKVERHVAIVVSEAASRGAPRARIAEQSLHIGHWPTQALRMQRYGAVKSICSGRGGCVDNRTNSPVRLEVWMPSIASMMWHASDGVAR